MAPEVVLYDLPSKDGPRCWSLNPWKVRFVLNWLKIPYTTEWIEYPDIAPRFKEFGIAPNVNDSTAYTIPAVRLNGEYIMDSKPICAAIEKAHGQGPLLRLDSPSLAAVEKLFGGAMLPLMPIWMPRVPRNLLNQESVGYFERTRAERVGPLADFMRDVDDPELWAGAKPAIDELAKLLKQNTAGPYFDGDKLGYADIVLTSALKFCRRIDMAIFNKFVAHDKAFSDLWAATEQWYEKED